jgi:hypothetical protein
MFFLFGTFSLLLSKSEKNYQKLVDVNGKDFADRVKKTAGIGGWALLACSVIWVGIGFL